MSGHETADRLRARLGHPVIDADGHLIEAEPVVLDHLRDVAGPDVVERFTSSFVARAAYRGETFEWYELSPEERFSRRVTRPAFWPFPAENTLDRATAMLPRLFHSRLDELGIDLAIVYPSLGLIAPAMPDEEIRRGLCRALNHYYVEAFEGLGDRLLPVAVIPMHTPEEALDELHHAVGELGFKAVTVGGPVRRPMPGGGFWLDNLALDSLYDYDPVWQACVDLGVPPTFHGGSRGWGSRTSVSNFNYNHIGHFAAASEATCKALLLGGVAYRFPTLRACFMEGGAAWAVSLLNGLVGNYEKRSLQGVAAYHPEKLDLDLLAELMRSHGTPALARVPDEHPEALQRLQQWDPEDLVDEFGAAGVTDAAGLAATFASHFAFGCEADDPLAALAFDGRATAFGTKLAAFFGSDIGHWDVPDIRHVLPEAWELVDHQLIDEADFERFVCGNIASVYTAMNPRFFDGTVLEDSLRPASTPA